MTELQKKILELYKIFANLCMKYDITYYLTAGSLLGAVRHNGFIPWDDDIDIIMTRANWEKFRQVAEKELPDYLEVHSQEDNPNYGVLICHITDKNSTELYRTQVSNPENTGLFLDIILMDPVPENEATGDAYRQAITKYTELTNLSFQYALRVGHKSDFRNLWKEAETDGLKTVLDRITEQAFHFSDEESYYYVQRYAGSPHFWPKKYFGKTRYVKFEDTEVPVPEFAEEIICIGFDDEWMYLPEFGAAERTTHDFCVRNYNIPSERIQADFETQINRQEFRKKLIERKQLWDDIAEDKIYYEQQFDRIAAAKTEYIYVNRLRNIDLFKLVKEENYIKLEEIFAEFINVQCNKQFCGSSNNTGWENWYHKNWPVLVDIGDDGLYASIFLLLQTHRIRYVPRILKARSKVERAMTVELCEIRDLYYAIKDCLNYYYTKQYDKSKHILEEWLSKYPNNPYLSIVDLKIKAIESNYDFNLIDYCNQCLERFDGDAEILLEKAKIYYFNDRKNEAVKLFENILNGPTRNCLVLKEIENYLLKLFLENKQDIKVFELYFFAMNRCGLFLENEDLLERWGDVNSSIVWKAKFEEKCKNLEDRYTTSERLLDMTKAIEKYPNDVGLKFLKASILHEIGSIEREAEIYQNLLEDANVSEDNHKEIEKRVSVLVSLWPNNDVFISLAKQCQGQMDNMHILLNKDNSENQEINDGIIECTDSEDVSKELDSEIVDFITIDKVSSLKTGLSTRLKLLKEFKDICDKNDITYYLIGKSLWEAVRNNGLLIDSNAEISVMMTTDNCKKFMDIINEKGDTNRYIDCMATNEYFHRFCVRYCDAETMDYSLTNYGNRFGIFITIEIVRHPLRNSLKNRIYSALEKGWEGLNVTRVRNEREKKIDATVARLCKTFGRSYVGKKLFYMFMNEDTKHYNQDKYYIKFYHQKRFYMPKPYFDFASTISFMGDEVTTVAFKERFLYRRFGKQWRTKKIPMNIVNGYRRLIDEKITSEDFIQYLKERGFDLDKIWSSWRNVNRIYADIRKLTKYAENKWDIMQATGRRYELAEKYNPKIDYLKNLCQSQQDEILLAEMREYIQSVLEFDKKGLCLSFQPDLDAICDYCLKIKGKDKEAKRIWERIEKAKWPTIDMFMEQEESNA